MTNSTRCALLAKQACTTLSHVVQKITPPSANNFLKLFFALFAMLALGVGNAWGADVTCDFTTKSASQSSYKESWKYGEFTVFGGANNNKGWAYVKMGGSNTNLSAANPVYISSPQITSSISKVQVSVIAGSLPKTGMSVNSWGVYVYSDANMTNQVDYVAGGTITKNAAVFELTPTSGSAWSANNYYKVSFDLANTSTTNGIIWLDKITFVESTDDGGETPDPTPVTVTLNKTELNLQAGATETLAATVTGSTESVTWSTDNPDVATVDNTGKVTAVAAGEATITAAIGDVKATCSVTVTAAPTPEEPGTDGEETWTLVTSTSDLKAGDIIVIASNTKGFVASSTITSDYMGQVNSTFSTDKSTITTLPAEAAQLTIGGTSGAWTLTYDGKQLGATTVKKVAWDSGTKTWSITIANDGGATIQNGTSSYGRFLHNVNSTRFTTYTSDANSSSMLLPQIYKKVTSSGEPSTPTPSVTLDPSSQDFGTINVGETLSQEFTITTENTTATLSASIDNTTDYAVSAIDGDKVTVTYQPQSADTHSAVLTVKAGEEATATVNLTGKAVQALEGTWILVTDASSLKAGDEIIIAAKESDVALSTTQADNNRPEVAITKNDNTITATSETQVLTLQAGNKENTLALYTGDGYLYAASSGSNYLRTETTLSDNSSWSIAVAADGTATLIAQGDNTRNTLYYNKNSNIFSCYSNPQQPIALYKNTNGQQLAGLAYTTTKYLTKLGDAFATPALTNPNSLTVTYSSSDDNVATVAADGAVTINAAGIATITASFAGNSSFLEGSASYTIGVTEHAGTQADPYSVADARRVIDVMETAEGVYATGIVSKIVTPYNSNYGNISYNISADGLTTSDQLQAYRGKSYDGANFTSADDVKVGDEVIVKGDLLKFESIYELNANNQLVNLKRDKQQAGLAYAVTELAAEVGATDFAEPELTNPNNLTVTYSSSNSTLATVNATTGEVTILAAGKVTITASTAGDATYAAGSASYNITISDPSLAVAQLPFTYNSGKADIENTAGMTQEGLGSDYTSDNAQNSKLKFDHTGDYIIIHFDTKPDKLMYNIKNNSCSGGEFSVQESTDGETYSTICTYQDEFESAPNALHTLQATSRYVKFIYTEKGNGNVGLGNIKITKPDLRQEASLVWSPSAVTLTQGDAFTAPTLQNPKSVSGITYESSNDEVATVTAEGEIALASAIGTATITATFAGDATYKPATATCKITINEYIETIDGEWELVTDASKLQAGMEIIIASVEVDGKYYAMSEASDNGNNRTAVESTISGEKLNPAVGTSVLTLVDAGNGTFALQAGNGKYLYAASSGSNHLKEKDEIDVNGQWTITIADNVATIKAEGSSYRNWMQFNPNNGSPIFSCYASDKPQKDIAIYAKVPDCTREIPVGYYGTVCLPSNIIKVLGATLYEVAGKEDNGRVVFDEVLDPEAGMPYIFLSHNAEVLFYCGTETATEAGKHNSLQGTFDEIAKAETNELTGNYMVVNNIIKKCGARCGLGANRAYFIATELESLGTAPAQMPGRRRVSMGMTGENGTTDLDNITTTDTPVKVIENGQLIIIRDGVKYNVQGQKL